MHYAKNIDVMDIGQDFGEDGRGWFDHGQDACAKTLTMVFQSLPDTRRAAPDGTTSFVRNVSQRLGLAEENDGLPKPSDEKKQGIIINPVSFETLADRDARQLQACARINPEGFAALEAKRAEIDAAVAKERETLEQEKQRAIEAQHAGGDRQAIANAYLETEHAANMRIGVYNHRIETLERGLVCELPSDQFRQTMAELKSAHSEAQAAPFFTLLDDAGISFQRVPDDHGNTRTIEIDADQDGFIEKLSALMDKHREAVLAKYSKAEFIISKPDGTALDKEQAARVITDRTRAMAKDAEALRAAAKKYGVTSLVAAEQRSGGWARGAQSGH